MSEWDTLNFIHAEMGAQVKVLEAANEQNFDSDGCDYSNSNNNNQNNNDDDKHSSCIEGKSKTKRQIIPDYVIPLKLDSLSFYITVSIICFIIFQCVWSVVRFQERAQRGGGHSQEDDEGENSKKNFSLKAEFLTLGIMMIIAVLVLFITYWYMTKFDLPVPANNNNNLQNGNGDQNDQYLNLYVIQPLKLSQVVYLSLINLHIFLISCGIRFNLKNFDKNSENLEIKEKFLQDLYFLKFLKKF